MRRIAGPAIVVAVAVAVAPGFGLGLGCSHEAKPAVQPDEPPPLPPASGTPIGYLFEDARLKLSDDQVAKLKVIDGDLAVQLSYLDSVLRNTGSGAPPKDEHSRGGIGFGASGERDGQYSGNMSTPNGAGNGALGGGRPPGAGADNAEIIRRVPEVRAYNVRTAVARALALLDPEQQKIARQVFKDRGVDPDTGEFEGKGEPGAVGREGVK